MPRTKNVETPLIRKLAKAFSALGKLPRRGKNQGKNYDFTLANDVFEAVRLELFKRDVLILPSEAPPQYVDIGPSIDGKHITECRLSVTYTVVTIGEKMEPMTFNGVGRDTEDKALYKAQTGAEKAFIKKLALMAEEVDDPEFDGQESGAPTETLDDVAPTRQSWKQQPIRQFEISNFQDACAATGKTADEQSGYLLNTFKIASIAELKRKHFRTALAWASNGAGTLAPKLQAVASQKTMQFPATAEGKRPSSDSKYGVDDTKGSYAL